jgi:hypothetical protein
VTTVKRFADACYKDEKGITRGIAYPENKESIQKREKVIISLIEIKLRRS